MESDEIIKAIRESSIASILEMGFTREQAIRGLKYGNDDIANAIAYLFNEPTQASAVSQDSNKIPERSTYSYDVPSYQENNDQALQVWNDPSSFQNIGPYGPQERGVIENGSEIITDHYNSMPLNDQIYNTYSNFDSLTEILPSNRAREADTPVMLLPSPAAIDLAPLIMILHSIPLSRKALLNYGNETVEDFGYDEAWWAGALIDMSDQLGDSDDDNQSGHLISRRLIVESQRLMAFLDGGSKRSFATLDNLLLGIPPGYESIFNGQVRSDNNTIGLFLKSLVEYWGENNELSDVFGARVVSTDQSEILVCNLSVEVTSPLPTSLYQIIDEMVWPDGDYENWFVKIPDILTLTFKRSDEQSGIGFTIPEVWRPDRYTKEFMHLVKQLKQRQEEVENKLAVLRNNRFKLSNFQGKSVVKVLDVSVDYFEKVDAKLKDDQLVELDELKNDDPISRAKQELISLREKWTNKIKNITNEITLLEQELERIIQCNKRGELNSGTDSKDTIILRDYILSGVILSPNEFYIRTKKGQLIDDDEIEWYKFHYNAIPSISCFFEKVSMEQVIEIAAKGSVEFSGQEVSVVYTSPNAWDDSHRISLPPKLDEFIILDRIAFEDEQSRESDPIVLDDFEHIEHIEAQDVGIEEKVDV